MSRKTRRNQARPPTPAARPVPEASRAGRRAVVAAGAGAVLLAIGTATYLLYPRGGARPAQPAAVAQRPGLASDHSPTLGDAGAKVHIVEFLDPACETCAAFYPIVKQLLADNPGRIRLSIRHVPLHKGSDDVVRFLEASRKQDKYWQTLEALLASQARWAPNHTAQPDLARQAIAGVGLDPDRLAADMNAPEDRQRMERDRSDAAALNVTQTPEYFVNGRQMPSFGRQQLRDLVRDALQSAYR